MFYGVKNNSEQQTVAEIFAILKTESGSFDLLDFIQTKMIDIWNEKVIRLTYELNNE